MDLPTLLDVIARGPVSGEALGRELGLSRAAVWKGVEALRAEGLGIEAGRSGYRLVDPAGFGPATLAWRLGRPVDFHPRCGSTNALCRAQMSADPKLPGLVVVADHQEEGRGRQGRRWESPPGCNLLVSFGLRPALPPHLAPRAVLIWAAAVAEELGVSLKWPNDLVDVDGQKLGGFLAEMESESEAFGRGARVRLVVLGLGLNVLPQDFPPALASATTLAAVLGVEQLDRAAVLARILGAIESVDPADPAGLDLWRARAHTLGRRVRVGEIQGIAEALREDGALIVGGRPILTGDVELVGC